MSAQVEAPSVQVGGGGSKRCLSCGQFAGDGHTCPLYTSAGQKTILTALDLPEPPTFVDFTKRVQANDACRRDIMQQLADVGTFPPGRARRSGRRGRATPERSRAGALGIARSRTRAPDAPLSRRAKSR